MSFINEYIMNMKNGLTIVIADMSFKAKKNIPRRKISAQLPHFLAAFIPFTEQHSKLFQFYFICRSLFAVCWPISVRFCSNRRYRASTYTTHIMSIKNQSHSQYCFIDRSVVLLSIDRMEIARKIYLERYTKHQ